MAQRIPPWGALRAAIETALAGHPHARCFLDMLNSVIRRGFGAAALVVVDGKILGALREVRHQPRDAPVSGEGPRYERRHCRDSEYLGPAMLILERLRLQGSGLAEPSAGSVRWDGEELGQSAYPEEMEARVQRWLAVTEKWSRRPDAIAAFVCAVEYHRVGWLGIYLTALPGPVIRVGSSTS